MPFERPFDACGCIMVHPFESWYPFWLQREAKGSMQLVPGLPLVCLEIAEPSQKRPADRWPCSPPVCCRHCRRLSQGMSTESSAEPTHSLCKETKSTASTQTSFRKELSDRRGFDGKGSVRTLLGAELVFWSMAATKQQAQPQPRPEQT